MGKAEQIIDSSYDQNMLTNDPNWNAAVLSSAFNKFNEGDLQQIGMYSFLEGLAELVAIVVVVLTVMTLVKMFDPSILRSWKFKTMTGISCGACVVYWSSWALVWNYFFSEAAEYGYDVSKDKFTLLVLWIVLVGLYIWAFFYYKAKLAIFESVKISPEVRPNTPISVGTNNTKACPYCGEEILAIAKKCKHCGEWLTKDSKPTSVKMIACPTCGEDVEEGTAICPHCKENIPTPASQPAENPDSRQTPKPADSPKEE